MLAKRQEIMRRAARKDDYIASWFSFQPVSRPAPKKPTARARPASQAARTLSRVRADRCASRSSAREAFRRATAVSKPSPKSFPRGWRRAGTSHRLLPRASSEPDYRGVRLVYLPTIRHKYFDTIAHTFLSTLHLLVHRVGCGALLQRRQRDLHLDAARRWACRSR